MENKMRLHVVDALRGFAIVSIMFLHNIEHFDFYFEPAGLPQWMQAVDGVIWDTMFFLFGGKSYAIFAFLFGLTFYIQSDNSHKRGKPFKARFAWRLLLLLGFGIINSAFYQGDILFIYALIGFFMIPFERLGNKWVLISAIILMLQPYEWIQLVKGIKNPEMAMSDPASWAYFGKMGEYISNGSFWDVVRGNLTNGKPAVLLWNWENGRFFQTLSLFLFGMLAGRKSIFDYSAGKQKFWRNTIIISMLSFAVLYYVQLNLGSWIESQAILRPSMTIEKSWANMAFMMVLVSGFVLLFHNRVFHRVLNVFSPLGCMSLSNYIMQSVIGAFIYYGFGLGLYQYTGASYSLIIGLALAVFQGWFSSWWMNRHKRGPLETLWHKATWVGVKGK